MWRKPENQRLDPPGPSHPVVPSAQQSGAATPQDPANEPAAVSKGIKIKGEISGSGNFSLDGQFEGKLRLLGGTFTVGPTARVNAEIEAREIIIRGEVIGHLKGCERVHIWSTGKLTGDLETHGIVVEEGAVLHSKVAVPQAALREHVAPEAPESEIERPRQPSSSEPRAKGAAGA